MKINISLLFMLLFLFLFSCTATKTVAEKPQIAPIIKDFTIPLADTSQTLHEPKGELTLVEALHLALMQNPLLSVYSLEIRAREAAALQAVLLPNPELMMEVENFAGSGPFSSFKSSETTLSVGQVILLAGKRQKRANAAKLESDLAASEYESRRLDVFVLVVTAVNNVIAAQEQATLNREVLALTEEFKTNIARLVQGGRISPVELSRANVEIANARIALQRRENELTAARLELAATWGSSRVTFSKVTGQLDYLSSLPSLKALQLLLNQNPDLSRWKIVKKQRRALYELADARRIPDPILSGGYRYFNGTNDYAFVAELSIPLPLFDRNQGARQEAEIRLNQSEWQERTNRIDLQTILGRNYQMLTAAHHSLQALKEEIIPQAQQAYDAINQGYRQGKFRFLDVLDARRTLFSSREAYLQNLKDYQQTRSQIERLIGQSLENVKL